MPLGTFKDELDYILGRLSARILTASTIYTRINADSRVTISPKAMTTAMRELRNMNDTYYTRALILSFVYLQRLDLLQYLQENYNSITNLFAMKHRNAYHRILATLQLAPNLEIRDYVLDLLDPKRRSQRIQKL